MSLTFYYSPQSSATPVLWTLEELGVPYEKVLIDLKKGDQRQEAFLKLNPNAKVPLIVHEGVPIFESAAIQMYLGEMFGVQKGLYPEQGPRRGEAMKWITWCNVTVGEAVSRYWHNTSDRTPAEQRNAQAAEAGKTDIMNCLRILDEALAGKQYLVGDRFTLADLHLASWCTYMTMFGFDLAPYKNISSWVARCTERPGFARTNN